MESATKEIDREFDAMLRIHQEGMLDQAEAGYQEILRRAPRHHQSLGMLGILGIQRSHLDDALRYADLAIAIEPRISNTHATRGNALHGLKRHEEAIEAYQVALRLDPGAHDVLTNLANALNRQGHFERAMQCYDRALAICPTSIDTHYNRGVALFEKGKHAEALIDFDAVLARSSDDPDAQCRRIYALCGLHLHQDALAESNKAIARHASSVDAWRAHGHVLLGMGNSLEAAQAFERVIALGAQSPRSCGEDHFLAARSLIVGNRHDEALLHLEKALDCDPVPAYAAGDRFLAMAQLVRWHDFDSAKARLCEAVMRGEPAASPFVMAVGCDDLEVIRRAGATFMAHFFPDAEPSPLPERSRHERIRLGYFSADFHAHATTLLIAELLEKHDNSKFEVFLFSFGPSAPDDMTKRLTQSIDHFLDVSQESDSAVCALSRKLEIDIAIDLKGYTQNCRPRIFAERAAPVQVNYLGYPASMGTTSIDYIVGDAIVTPPEHAPFYAEKFVSLPHCYQPNAPALRSIAPMQGDKASARNAAGLPANGFVFCCFNNTYKITPAVFAVWMRVLHAVPDSVLWLYRPDSRTEPRLRQEALNLGISPERLVFAPRQPLPDHLSRHALADLFLDTFPCNAHTTGSDALWAGLPLLTCLGTTFASRVAASLLHAVGLPEMVMPTLEAYATRAIELAADPIELQRQGEHLHQARTNAPLFDMERYRSGIEAAYRMMMERHMRREPPIPLVVPA
ncbi:glycosyltransferase family 41 protein [Variovorax sp. OV700]|uniref:tetratricopeptide repeat protein n=1 Tax=Variovorax sp. OV700 TaxID=1882826 RepID=UPI00088F19DC|nr:glycosyltransferase family 41 protein [Variovorax sp. OV700]SDJ58945.1 Predicted O-linked N-acetylglucosamine transferase, SPINDLY family [Variovorax sp. OV700]